MMAAVDIPRHDVRMDGVYFVRAWADDAFVKSLEAGNYSYCVMVQAGRLIFEIGFPDVREFVLEAGDAVAVSGLSPHTFRSIVGVNGHAAEAFERRPLTEVAPCGSVELILGVAPDDGLALGSLMIGPIIVRRDKHPDLSRRLWRAVEMLQDEYGDDSWIDRNLVIRRLAEIMLVNMSRRVFADRGLDVADGSRVLANPRVMRAIRAFFATPHDPWTLGDLARAAGMSRTRFAEEFKRATGQTPGQIVSRMRLTAVARRLLVDAVSVEAAAAEAGYSSAAAFVRAFQRTFGETPARWRGRRTIRAAAPSPRGAATPAARVAGRGSRSASQEPRP